MRVSGTEWKGRAERGDAPSALLEQPQRFVQVQRAEVRPPPGLLPACCRPTPSLGLPVLGVRVKKFQRVVRVVAVLHGAAEELVGPGLGRPQHEIHSAGLLHPGRDGDPLHHPAVARRLGADDVRPWGQESPVVSVSSWGKEQAQQSSVFRLTAFVVARLRMDTQMVQAAKGQAMEAALILRNVWRQTLDDRKWLHLWKPGPWELME